MKDKTWVALRMPQEEYDLVVQHMAEKGYNNNKSKYSRDAFKFFREKTEDRLRELHNRREYINSQLVELDKQIDLVAKQEQTKKQLDTQKKEQEIKILKSKQEDQNLHRLAKLIWPEYVKNPDQLDQIVSKHLKSEQPETVQKVINILKEGKKRLIGDPEDKVTS